MNLYLISQTVNKDYETYDGAVVCAENEEKARLIHPYYGDRECFHPDDAWVKTSRDVQIKLIGVANKDIEKGVLIASFNPG